MLHLQFYDITIAIELQRYRREKLDIRPAKARHSVFIPRLETEGSQHSLDSGNNRTHAIRIPDTDRFEFRLADGAANPYLLPAALIACGLDGITQQRDPGPRYDHNAYTAPRPQDVQSLPTNLLDALRSLEADRVLPGLLGQEFVNAYLRLKYQDWRNYSDRITPWETETTMDC